MAAAAPTSGGHVADAAVASRPGHGGAGRGWRIVGFVIAAIVLLLVLALGGLWVWAGTDGSLRQALHLAGRYLPLQAQGVTGSIRAGGTVEHLSYDQNGLKLDVRDAQLKWQPTALLDKTLKLQRLSAGAISVEDKRAPTPAEPSSGPPQSLKLPVKIEVDRFAVDHFKWAGPPPVAVDDIAGSYAYDGKQHRLSVDSIEVMNGRYRAQATLTDSAPIQVDAHLAGQLSTDVPGGTQGVGLAVDAHVKGALTDLAVTANAQATVPGGADNAGAAAPRANVVARITPWAAQPLPNADARLSDFDVGALLPAAPHTQLTGELHVTPAAAATAAAAAAPPAAKGAGWHLKADIDNALAGPWDKRRLPLQRLQAEGEWRDGTALIEQLQAQVGGGLLRAQGKWISPPSTPTVAAAATAPASAASEAAGAGAPAAAGSGDWQVQATLEHIDPARLQSQLASLPLDGKVTASGEGAAIDFDLNLRANAAAAPRKTVAAAASSSSQLTEQLRQLRLQEASAKGRWADGRLSLSALEVRTDDAKLTGTLDVRPAGPGGAGQLRFDAPGLQVRADGELRENSGGGVATIAATDVARMLDWAGGLPGVPASLKQADARGQATLTAHWKGGWRDPSLDLKLDAPKLDYVPPPSAEPAQKVATTAGKTQTLAGAAQDAADQTIRLRDFQATVSGKLSRLDLKADGRAELGQRKLKLDVAATGGRVGGGDQPLAESAWQGKVTKLDASVQDPAIGKGPWQLSVKNDVSLKWSPTPGSGSFQAGAGKAVLAAPRTPGSAPSQATIEWDPVRWASGELTTKGRLSGLPMAWAELATGGELAGGRVSGDMVFNGDWDVSLGQKFDVKANLYRASGDLSIEADPEAGAGSRIAAGVKDARLSVHSNSGGDLNVDLNWKTDRAGQMNGRLSTKLTRDGPDGGWKLASDAPLAGNLKVSLPKLGIWSRLAPPGWRLEGGIDTDVRMAGTLSDPRLVGTISADDLSLRSIVDGFEFTDGRLRAKVDGQRLLVDEFSLHGAGGRDKGGSIVAKGEAALVDGKPQAKLSATLDHLRPSIRTDAEIAVSGRVNAQLADQVASVTGALKVDRARIELPEETAPSLGDDVVVQRAGKVATGAKAAAATTSKTAARGDKPAAAQVVKLDVKIDLGNDFRVSGLGLNSGLKGELDVTGESLGDPHVTGTIRTVDGRFQAYGQKLDISRGMIRFTGQPTNPSLDVLALRSNMEFSSVKVGVQITGNALLPQVSLYSEPDMADSEKLSWLVLGRASAASGAEAALLQTAAVALLSGKNSGGGIASKFGLDELSLGDAKGAGGSTTGQTAVTLGKRFSKNFYAAYERSLSGAVGTLFLFYDLSKRFTLRGATGERSALDLIYTLKYD